MEIKNISTENFDKEVIQANQPVLIDFYADWCGPCRMMAPIIEEIASQAENKIQVAKVNIDENQDLAIKYDIVNIPTLVLFKNGGVDKTFVGVRDKNEILDAIQ